MNLEAYDWTVKYRPRKVEDLIATDEIKRKVQGILDRGISSDLLLAGPPGIGKTTIARLIVEALDAEFTFINASLEGNIDKLRNDMTAFAGSMSLLGTKRYIILDEADNLTQATQPALRGFMDQYKENCGFIATVNYLSKVIDPLRSRFDVYTFKIAKKDLPALAKQFYDRACEILSTEGYEWDKPALAQFIMKNAPDWRKCLIKLQGYAQSNGRIDSGILGQQGSDIDDLIKMIKEKKFADARKYLGEQGVDQTLYEDLYKCMESFVHPKSIEDFVILVSKYQYQSAFVADQEVNAAACIAEIMANCQFV